MRQARRILHFHDNFRAGSCYGFPVLLPADPATWKEKPPRLALLRTVAAVPLLASALLAWRQWRDAERRVRAPWEERAAFSAQTLASSAAEKLAALTEREGVVLRWPETGTPLDLHPPRAEAERQAAERVELALNELRSAATPPEPARLQALAEEHRDSVTEAGLPAPPLIWYAARFSKTEGWIDGLTEAVLTYPSLLNGKLLESVKGFVSDARKPALAEASQRWREVESLCVSLTPAAAAITETSGRFWTPDGGWLVTAEASRTVRGVRAAAVRERVVDSLQTPDARLVHRFEIAGKTWPETTENAGGIQATEMRNGVTARVWLKDEAALRAELSEERRTLLALPVLAAVSGLGGWLALERALRRQERLSRLKTDFVSSVSHELRAPVAGIRLLAERMAAGKADAAQSAEYSRLIEREARRVSALVENVLDFARIENGRKAWRFEPCDPAQAVREAVETMEPLASARRVTLVLKIDGESTLIQADAAALRQAVVNLLDNAVKFSPAGEIVSSGVKSNGQEIQISVRDNGCGIPPEELPWIFERFFRGGEELRRETAGAGIGLSLVRHIAQVHGGAVEVKSTPGKGSVFVLKIPSINPENPL